MIDSINLTINDKLTKVKVIRYFLNAGQRYLIYTLDEKDDAGYIKLYVTKMDYNPIRAVAIIDDDEWNRIKELIKVTIKENRENSALSIIDLNYADIENIVVEDSKVFKLLDSMVEILSSNKKLFEDANDIVIENNISKGIGKIVPEEIMPAASTDTINYKDLYLKEVENRKMVENELKKAIQVIDTFKEKISEINEILN